MNPVGTRKFNFNKFVNNLDVNLFLNDNSILPCDCTSFLFVDKDDNQITTGNLKVIDNNKLRKRFSRGSKYRESRIADYQKAKERIITGIRSCIQSWCNKHCVSTASYFEWKEAVMVAIDEKISHISTKVTTGKSKSILKSKNAVITEKSKVLHHKFVAVPIDKTDGNVAFIC